MQENYPDPTNFVTKYIINYKSSIYNIVKSSSKMKAQAADAVSSYFILLVCIYCLLFVVSYDCKWAMSFYYSFALFCFCEWRFVVSVGAFLVFLIFLFLSFFLILDRVLVVLLSVVLFYLINNFSRWDNNICFIMWFLICVQSVTV